MARGPAVRGVSHKVHYILAGIVDDAERFEAIDAPPLDERVQIRRWTTDLAKKYVGQRPDRPETPAQKVAAIHRLADDDEVAAQVATDVLRRPAVAARVVTDDTARHMVNKAQTTQHKTGRGRTSPAADLASPRRSCWR
ncbi:DUF6192 family protein [Streptomyces sp. DSM 15324]|uniref:DUF6192 family protein n=1 Tax=Streptomyces sp. DSM 15324 TaxID=1739111 RepID=UPI003B638EEF